LLLFFSGVGISFPITHFWHYCFFQQAGLREWLDTAIVTVVLVSDEGEVEDSEEGRQYLLPPCNSFLRKVLYQHIETEYPSLILENAGHEQIRVLRLSPAEQKARDRRLQMEAWENLIRDQLGVWRVYEAIRRTCNGEVSDVVVGIFYFVIEFRVI
jgi:hypothetical protein